jgi:hypothetical protein
VLDPDALAALEEQRAFLARSLVDLDRERAAGDLEDEDFRALHDDYEHRLTAVRDTIADGKAALSASRRPSNPRRTVIIISAVVLFAVGCGFVVANLAGRRGSGEEVSGETRLSTREQLAECLSKGFAGAVDDTIRCYEAVLVRDPANVEAKTYRAGLQVMAKGDAAGINQLIDVAKSNPDYPDVHAFLAVAFDLLGRPDSALAELHKLDTLNPTPLVLDLTSQLRARLESSTTTSTTTP